MRTSTLHIKVSPQFAQRLKSLANKRSVPVGELVRDAVSSSYQLDLADLSERQRAAVSAYQGGYISIGKLAEEMGLNVFAVREWLAEHDMPQNSCYTDTDTDHA
jgi:predicted HTH domain antitoxin